MGEIWITKNGNSFCIEQIEPMPQEFYEIQTENKHKEKELLGIIKNISEEKALSKLKSYEKLIANEPGENAIVITKDGKIFRCFGNRENVWPTRDVKNRDILYITHNHPHGVGYETFGEEDITLFLNNASIKVLRGISDNYTYEFTRLNTMVDRLPNLDDNEIDVSVHMENINRAKKEGWGYTRKKRKQNKTFFIF